jgi:hypothetical protein
MQLSIEEVSALRCASWVNDRPDAQMYDPGLGASKRFATMTGCCSIRLLLSWAGATLALALLAQPARAGPPYVSDDPEPTDYGHFEIYTFNNGTATRDGTAGESGVDFNHGAAPDLQLTATCPRASAVRLPGAATSVGATSNLPLNTASCIRTRSASM